MRATSQSPWKPSSLVLGVLDEAVWRLGRPGEGEYAFAILPARIADLRDKFLRGESYLLAE